jgi:hypothetical protein
MDRLRKVVSSPVKSLPTFSEGSFDWHISSTRTADPLPAAIYILLKISSFIWTEACFELTYNAF